MQIELFKKFINWNFPDENSYPQAMFGAIRKHDIHTGIDIYVPENTEVFPIISGQIINIEWFTGEYSNPPTPWWNNTKAIWIKNKNLNTVFVYGELEPNENLKLNSYVETNTCLGKIKKVLKKDKKTNPSCMLHLEYYSNIPKETVIWNLGKSKPALLEDPMIIINELMSKD